MSPSCPCVCRVSSQVGGWWWKSVDAGPVTPGLVPCWPLLEWRSLPWALRLTRNMAWAVRCHHPTSNWSLIIEKPQASVKESSTPVTQTTEPKQLYPFLQVSEITTKMNNFKRRALIFVTFFGSCLALSLLAASLGTNHWVTASCKRTENAEKSNGTVNMGLFQYETNLNVGYGDRYKSMSMLGTVTITTQ